MDSNIGTRPHSGNIVPKRRVPAVERAVEILDCIATSQTPPGVSELARRLKLPKSSVHGLCETLLALGLLQTDAGGYAIGARSLRWSSAYLNRSDLVSDFEHLVAQDSRLDACTVTLTMLDHGDVIYLACRNSAQPLGFTFQRGMRLPAIYSATGKAMLSWLPPQQRLHILREHWCPPYTANSVKTPQIFEQEAQEWREQGYSLDRGELREGMVCIGAPVLDDRGHPVAAIAISMTQAELKPEVERRFSAIAIELAGKLARH